MTVQLSQSKITAPAPCGVIALINCQGLYDYNNMKFIQDVLADGGHFFDVGANIGSYSLLASECSGVTVDAFEPHPATFKALISNLQNNNRTNVRAHNVALTRANQVVRLTDSPLNSANHLIDSNDQASVAIEGATGETYLPTDARHPAIAKIDVEGFEYDVLLGFCDRLTEIDVFLIEVNRLIDARSVGRDLLLEHLAAAGFVGPLWVNFDQRTFVRDPSGPEDPLFLSPSFVEDLTRLGYQQPSADVTHDLAPAAK
jgi:FkbM family methyltransferase